VHVTKAQEFTQDREGLQAHRRLALRMKVKPTLDRHELELWKTRDRLMAASL
jgi:hypothetical protein